MPYLYLVRHAESLANAGGISLPNADIPLSTEGFAQARQLAAQWDFRPAQVVTSAFLRTRQTAQPWLERLGMEADTDPLLNEFTMIGYSLVRGLNGAQRLPLARRWRRAADPDLRMGEDAETFREFLARVEHFLDTLPARQNGSVLFTHGMFIRLLIWRLLGLPADSREALQRYGDFHAPPIPNCARLCLFWRRGRGDAGIRFCD